MDNANVEEEIWRDISGYEGFYQVSNLGNVRSVDRVYTQMSKYHELMQKRYKGRLLTPQIKQSRYYTVHLKKNNRRERKYIHRLVAEAFIDNPENKPEVNHKDFNRLNNNVRNLEWVTRKENMMHASPMCMKPKRTKPSRTGEKYITTKNNLYRLIIKHKYSENQKTIDKLFKTLDEAIKAREMIINGKEYNAS